MKKRKRKPALSKEQREARRRSATTSTGSNQVDREKPLPELVNWDPPLKDLMVWEPLHPWEELI